MKATSLRGWKMQKKTTHSVFFTVFIFLLPTKFACKLATSIPRGSVLSEGEICLVPQNLRNLLLETLKNGLFLHAERFAKRNIIVGSVGSVVGRPQNSGALLNLWNPRCRNFLFRQDGPIHGFKPRMIFDALQAIS